GAVASAGIIALARSMPTILSSFASSLKDLRDSRLGQAVTRLRTEDGLPTSLAVGGSVALAIVLALLPQVAVNLLGAILIVIFGFFFATVSSRICGQIGSSANPISGMTIAALLGTCLIFVAIGWTGVDHRVQAISIAAVVAVAAANAGNTSQDLKTGFLVGSTPRRQQIAILVGALGSALVVGWTLTLLNRAYTYPVPETHPAFSAQALAPAAGGAGRAAVEVLPQTMSAFRVAASDSVDRATYGVVRVYLPISTSSAMFAGGVVRWLIERRAQARQQSIAEVESGPGVLFASGLIAGGAICGIVLAAIAGVLGSADALAEKAPLFHALGGLARSNLLAFGLFAALGVLLYRIGLRDQ